MWYICSFWWGGTRIRKLYRIFPAAVLLVLVCELFALNYPSLWHRESPSQKSTGNRYYNDGTKDAAAYLKAQDVPFTASKSPTGRPQENDGMAQGYNGLSTYMSTNPSSLVSYHKMYGPESISINFVDFNNDDYIRVLCLEPGICLETQGTMLHRRYIHWWGEAGGKNHIQK